MEKRKIKNKSWLITGSLLLLIGIALIGYDYYSNKKINKLEDNALTEFYEKEENISVDTNEDVIEENQEDTTKTEINYIAVLKIPKINLERGLVEPSSYLNDVKYNVEILDDSDMPDVKNGNFILASHSGNAKISYFKNLNKLEINDTAEVIYEGKTYTYKVVDIYEIEKTGTAEIIRDKNKNILTLITCKHGTNNQIIVICELVNND